MKVNFNVAKEKCLESFSSEIINSGARCRYGCVIAIMMNNCKYLLIFLLLLLSVSASSKVRISGCVVDENNDVLPASTVQLMTTDSMFVKGAVSDSQGVFLLEDVKFGSYIVSVSYIGYESCDFYLDNIKSDIDVGVITMSPASKLLQGVEVKGSRIVQKIDRQTLTPTKLQIKSSSNGVSLLQHLQLPRITVSTIDNTVKTVNGDNVQLRINGVPVDISEVKAIQPNEVFRVEYHDMPGLRYGNVSAVLDFIVKHKEKGGTVSGDLTNGVSNLGVGDYQMSANYHGDKSELKTIFNWTRRDLKWIRENYETFNANTSSVYNEEIGEPTKVKYDNVNFALGYNYTVDKSMMSITFKDVYGYSPNSLSDRISTLYQGDEIYKITDNLSSRENVPSLDIYYQTELKNNQHLYFDIVGTYINSNSNRIYKMFDNTTATDICSSTEGDKYSVIGEAIYERFFKSSKLSFGAKYTQMFTRNLYGGDVESTVRMNTSEAYAFAEFQSKIKDFSYTFGLGAMRTYNNQEGNFLEKYIFRPTLSLSYNIANNIFVKYNGFISGYSPSLSDLSNISQDIDYYQIRRGNPNLESVSFISNTLALTWNLNKVNLELFGRYSYDDKPIMEETLYEDGKFVRTIDNQKGFHRLNAQLNMQIHPWNEYLSIQLAPFFNRYIAQGNKYTHTHSNWGFRGNILAMYKAWVFIANIETSYHNLWGETLTKEENSHNIGLGYNMERWSIQAMIANPFTKKYKQEVENWSAAAPNRQLAFSNELRRVIMLNVSFNLNYGKQKNSVNKKISNSDLDSGIMHGR